MALLGSHALLRRPIRMNSTDVLLKKSAQVQVLLLKGHASVFSDALISTWSPLAGDSNFYVGHCKKVEPQGTYHQSI